MILHQLLRRTLVPVIVGLGLWTTVKSVPAVEYATGPKCRRAGAFANLQPGRDFLEGQRDRGLLSMVALRSKGGQGWFRGGGGGGVQGSVMVETVTATGQRAAVPSSQTSCASAQPFWNLRVSEAVLISRLRVLQRIRWHELSVGAGNFWMEWAVCTMGKIFLWSEVRGGLGCVVSSCRVEWVRDLCYAFDAIWKIKRVCATGECGRSEEGVERRTLQLLPKHIRFFPLLV
ncbi:hypothetical protein CTAM01_04519 [Colletotrichum tamarilloi]|uniref:Uncharacterized protein n=1 Tax=Colletotrichum tamarilloi TaxID=1209934 RepID=A0ABQ9RGC1_9PEZI|nr:uncharacterized protein CTAM01_04519 [Colletotrichum tamarilloi]KAK1503207.1 hypothetical protein CTAM01_04519 [Colletotrichum tamarilloi]